MVLRGNTPFLSIPGIFSNFADEPVAIRSLSNAIFFLSSKTTSFLSISIFNAFTPNKVSTLFSLKKLSGLYHILASSIVPAKRYEIKHLEYNGFFSSEITVIFDFLSLLLMDSIALMPAAEEPIIKHCISFSQTPFVYLKIMLLLDTPLRN